MADRLVDFLNQKPLFEESPAVCWSTFSGNSTTSNRLQFDVWIFGIAFLNIALFEMALRRFCLHVQHMWKDYDQVDASLPQGLRRLPQGLCLLQVQ
jgi:hypothetical protein